MSHRFKMAAFIAAAATIGVSATAQANTVELKSDGTLTVRAASGENNNLHVSPQGVPGVKLRDFGAKLSVRGSGCTVTPGAVPSEVICAGTVRAIARVDVALGNGNDLYAGQQGLPTIVDGGAGDDEYFHDGKAGLTTTRTDFRGGAGDDTASYGPATAGVIVTKDGVANDGRTINGTFVIDRDNIRDDVERLFGSPHNDSLNASNLSRFPGKPYEYFFGAGGDDIMTGGPADDFFDMGGTLDGADIVRGNGDTVGAPDVVSYTNRVNRVVVTVGHGNRDDGEAGEGDDVSGVERVFAGRGSDTVIQAPGSLVGLSIFGGPGNDTLIGASGRDGLIGEAGADTYLGGPNADNILAADGERDSISCGDNPPGDFDSAQVDAVEQSVRDCENSSVGKLALKASGTDVKVSWTHPKAWRKVKSVEVRVLEGGRQVGEITIDPRRSKLAASGDVDLARSSRLARTGKTVTARLALKVDRALAGRKLAFEVEATDVDGRRQVER